MLYKATPKDVLTYQQFEDNVTTDKYYPWYNYYLLYLLENNIELLKTSSIFEYGSGYSTIYFAQRCKILHSMETRLEWINTVSNILKDKHITNALVELQHPSNFASSIKKFSNKYNIIIIDSIQRFECAKNAISMLNDDGILIWDNSERINTLHGIQWMLDNNFVGFVFESSGWGRKETSQAIVFYKINGNFDVTKITKHFFINKNENSIVPRGTI